MKIEIEIEADDLNKLAAMTKHLSNQFKCIAEYGKKEALRAKPMHAACYCKEGSVRWREVK